MTNYNYRLIPVFVYLLLAWTANAQVKTNVRTNIKEVDQARRGLQLFKTVGDTTIEESQVQDTLVYMAEDSLGARLEAYEAHEEELKQLHKEIGEQSARLAEPNVDSTMLKVAGDTLTARLDQYPQARNLRALAARYSDLFKRQDDALKTERKVLKKERRHFRKGERRATREDSLLATRIRLNEIDIELAELEHEQDSANTLLKILQKEFLDSAELASLAQEFAPKEFKDASQELAKLGGNPTDPTNLLVGQQSSLPSTPDASALPGATLDVPQAPPPLPKYNTLAKDLMDPAAFTTGKFKDKEQLLDQGHQKLSELKTKYTKVPDSRDLKSAVKKNSLQEQPLRKRFFLTGTNNIQITRSFVALEFNGQVGYQFNRVWRAGVGGALNTEWYTDQPYARWKEGYPLSWHVFGQYTFFKSYLAHVEFEPQKTPAGGETPSDMRHKLLVGLGKVFAIPKMKNVDGVVLLLYDTTSGERLGSRFKVRFGVTVTL